MGEEVAEFMLRQKGASFDVKRELRLRMRDEREWPNMAKDFAEQRANARISLARGERLRREEESRQIAEMHSGWRGAGITIASLCVIGGSTLAALSPWPDAPIAAVAIWIAGLFAWGTLTKGSKH
jgi:hypothetical protein